jgi:hypothetical protein
MMQANNILKNFTINEASKDPSASLQDVEEKIETVSVSWARDWVRNSDALKWVKPRLIEPERSEGCRKEIIQEWFKTWEESVGGERLSSKYCKITNCRVQKMSRGRGRSTINSLDNLSHSLTFSSLRVNVAQRKWDDEGVVQ